MTEKTCSTCRHALADEPTDAANDAAASPKKNVSSTVCRRYPPSMQFIIIPRPVSALQPGAFVPVEERRSAFPNVMPDWTCGEYAQRIELAS